ncbi:penicillin-binding protein activator [Starkeya sp. ORNL1]|uniref:penicillin-binding protein activator n=1 Tax=Starkeya sp. ORNL1 TaxID=2709380 RepID=UPI0014636E3F|nr:penicillin-binding protein activator [Starkeya sp. ORNL1]QJP15480.1 penicillin-binding protein activator [Starkeya sp. ORNL1]
MSIFGLPSFGRTLRGGALAIACTLLAACGGGVSDAPPTAALPPEQPLAQQQPANVIGTGSTPVTLILPLGASGNAALAAQALRNAAEMAMEESGGADIRIIVKDDGGNSQGAQAAAQQAVDEGARAIIGPLFAHTVAAAGQVARSRSLPLVGFSTDTNVATQGVYLLSFLPETDVERVVRFAAARGKRSFIALLPENAYGSVVEAAFREAVPAAGGRIVGIERYATDKPNYADAARRLAAAAQAADAVFLPDAADVVPQLAQALTAAGVDLKRMQLMGTGLWDDPRMAASPSLSGGIYAAPDPAGFRAFAQRYRTRYGREPARTAALAHDAVSLMVAIVKSQGPMGITDQAIQSPAGFSGVDGIFRFKSDGTNQRGLAIMQLQPGGARVLEPAPRSFGAGAGL